MATPAKFGKPRPPEKGVFALDHFGECLKEKEHYMDCLKKQRADTQECAEFAKNYLECRMKNGLMAKQSLSELGFVEKQQQEQNSGNSKPR